MELCSDGHSEICYVGQLCDNTCPVCTVIKEMTADLDQAQATIIDLEAELIVWKEEHP